MVWIATVEARGQAEKQEHGPNTDTVLLKVPREGPIWPKAHRDPPNMGSWWQRLAPVSLPL